MSHLINEAVHGGSWAPVTLAPNSPPISHLFYVDDLILFSSASLEHATIIADCLDRFCEASGQAISRDKSSIFCSKNTSRQVASSIFQRLGIPLTQDLGKYLVVSVLHGRTTQATYQSIIDRMDAKLWGGNQILFPWQVGLRLPNQFWQRFLLMQCRLRSSQVLLVRKSIRGSGILYGGLSTRKGKSI
ncbi:hypothetical protein LINPERHAP2_LOCUS41979 [Linum perenne]